jgi:hypothetical protein
MNIFFLGCDQNNMQFLRAVHPHISFRTVHWCHATYHCPGKQSFGQLMSEGDGVWTTSGMEIS